MFQNHAAKHTDSVVCQLVMHVSKRHSMRHLFQCHMSVYGTIQNILHLCEMLKVGIPAKVDMHWASAAIILKFNGRQLCLVYI